MKTRDQAASRHGIEFTDNRGAPIETAAAERGRGSDRSSEKRQADLDRRSKVRANCHYQSHSTFDIQLPGALVQRSGTSQLLSGILHKSLDHVRRQFWIELQ